MTDRKNWLTDKKHKELTDKHDHYVCDICSEIGAQIVIEEIVEDLNYCKNGNTIIRIFEKIKKWEKRKK